MTIREKITFYTNVLTQNLPEEAVVALHNMLVTEMHNFKLSNFIVEDKPY